MGVSWSRLRSACPQRNLPDVPSERQGDDRTETNRISRDRIELRGLRLSAICGVLPEERTRPQPLEIDVDVVGDFSVAGRSDELTDTVDYGAVCDRIETICGQGAPQLLEYLAERIASDLLGVAGVAEVEVAIRKLRPPVPQQLQSSGVRITRRRFSDGVG